ncbi:hypothetical protein ZHAS_00017470 [Anopheles sinensis]|uniref:Uncharacterized protein n=1 Tax=Anopheles sinensis TaxID=74873 RepID=A0A084WGM8_ANOSI|nr:hypothetical protein ZHAS_00017470 [Anopheles sinensis]
MNNKWHRLTVALHEGTYNKGLENEGRKDANERWAIRKTPENFGPKSSKIKERDFGRLTWEFLFHRRSATQTIGGSREKPAHRGKADTCFNPL